ncbi:hypothetical protein SLA2020_368050 [Shorea laevis]
MLLGKRPRVPMKRTTSLSEITFDLNTNVGSAAPPTATVSPRNHRRSSADFTAETTTTPHFLRSCSLCKRRLVPGRDIYMYRGDSAFCSLECRQQQMNRDERMENCSLASKKEASASSTTAAPQVPTKGESVAAL